MLKPKWLVCRLLFGALVIEISGCGKGGDDATAFKTPATVEQAATILDLSTFPVMDGAKRSAPRVASFSCEAPGDVKSVFEFQRKKLLSLGFKELPNSSITDQAASAMFENKGFVVSVSVFPQEPMKVLVSIQNHGNIRPGKLPVPSNVKPVYVGDATAMYVTDAAVADTKDACQKLLLADGWVPFGGAGDCSYYKQNAMRFEATVSSAPAQGRQNNDLVFRAFDVGRFAGAAGRGGFALHRTDQRIEFRNGSGPEIDCRFLQESACAVEMAADARSHSGDRRQARNDFPEFCERHVNACGAASARRQTVGVASVSECGGDRGVGPATQRT